MEKGLIHIYTGDGKGKTTAALGLALRAKGAGLTVLIAQFLKGRDTGELGPLRALGIPVIRSDVEKFIPYMTPEEREECREGQQRCFTSVCREAASYDLVILDEIFAAVATGMIGKEQLLGLIRDKPASAELVLTGRDAPEDIVALADYVSEIRAVKHPYDRGLAARRGIEY